MKIKAIGSDGGYAPIRHYLRKTGKSIYEATMTPTDEIVLAEMIYT